MMNCSWPDSVSTKNQKRLLVLLECRKKHALELFLKSQGVGCRFTSVCVKPSNMHQKRRLRNASKAASSAKPRQ